ncbi:F-box/kelch-repeat protein At3g06240-like [Euphorbia lathyris]|uniref:F-box/kelch-repeat protein At3g06240-like n=1 Tax=Euphorbia lathyris TaxID=212925 RepID=UPI0033135D67
MRDYSALPDAVAETILFRLPMKLILQCRCVCKSWYSLIKSPNFISTYLRKTLTQNTQMFLHEWDISDKTGCCLLHFHNRDYFHSLLFHLPHNPNCWIQIVGSVNGLICFSIDQGSVNLVVNFVLCNPLIGHFLSIPPPHSSSSSVTIWDVKGFGFDETTLDYKILYINSDWDGFIYSLNSNCWKRIAPVPKNWDMQSNSVVFVNGRFHWFGHGHGSKIRLNMIMVFDVKGEAFDHIPLPKPLAESRYDIVNVMEFGGSSIAVIQQTDCNERFVIHIWMMKEYGSVESWVKLTVGFQNRGFIKRDEVLGFINKDEVLIKFNKISIVIYSA